MRKIFPIIAVLALLIGCAVPAFAVGDQQGGKPVYSAVPFDWFGVGFKYGAYYASWPFAIVATGQDYTTSQGVYDKLNDWDIVNFTTSVKANDTSILGEIENEALSGHQTSCTVSIGLENKIVDLSNYPSGSLEPYISTYNGEWTIGKIRVYGDYYVPYYLDDGTCIYPETSFDFSFYAQDWRVNLLDAIRKAVAGSKYRSNVMFFSNLTIDINFNNATGNKALRFEFSEVDNRGLKKYPLTMGSFTNSNPPYVGDPNPDDADTVVQYDFELGTFLSETVGGFLEIPVFGGITLGGILGAIFGLLFILWFIKVIK